MKHFHIKPNYSNIKLYVIQSYSWKNIDILSRNSYREVFVKDYQAWMKYESQGSFRLNKVARDILVRYCPFAKDIRQGLATNPQYQNAFHRLDAENRKKLQRFR